MSDETSTPSPRKMILVLLAFAPFVTLLYFSLGQALKDFDKKTEGSDGWNWHWAALLGGANLVWFALLASLIWLGTQIPFARLSVLAVEWWTSVDPNIVWYPWQAVALAAALGVVLIAIGAWGVVTDLTNKGEDS